MKRIGWIGIVACLALLTGCANAMSDSPGQSSDRAVCEDARDHVESCTGEPASLDGDSCSEADARRILDQSCEDLEAASEGKADGILSNSLCKVSVGMCNFRTIDAGNGFTCGLAGGAVKCWDANGEFLETPDVKLRTLSVGHYHFCGLEHGTDEPFCARSQRGTFEKLRSPSGTFTQVDAGKNHSCGVRADETIECWGPIRESVDTPEARKAPSGKFRSVDAGHFHTCGRRIDGTVECWGADPDFVDSVPDEAFKQIDVADNRHMACGVVQVEGRVVCWSDRGSDPLPGQPSTQTESLRVDVGSGFACSLEIDNTLECWGDQISGMNEAPEGEYSAVAAGHTHMCALKRDDASAECNWDRPEL